MVRYFIITLVGCFLFSCGNSSQPSPKSIDNTATNKAIIEHYFQLFNNHEWEKMAEMYIDQPEMKDPTLGITSVKMTKAEIVKKYSELNQMIPDVHDKILQLYHSGDNVIVEFESTGTAPDNTQFKLPICTIFEIKNGKITKDFTYYDNTEEEQK